MDDDDDARRAFAGELEQLDDGTNRRLARKADLHLMPVRCDTIQQSHPVLGLMLSLSCCVLYMLSITWIVCTHLQSRW